MPGPLNLPPAAMLERIKRQDRERQARRRARIKESHVTRHGTDTVTPPSPPTPPAPSKSRGSFGTPAGGNGKPRGNPRVSAVIDGLRARGFTASLSKRDCAAIKDSVVDPEQAVEAFAAASQGRWANDWLRRNLNMANVLERFAGYEATCKPARSGTNGVHHDPPSAVQLTAPLERIPPTEVSRAMAERATVPLKEKLALAKNGKHG